MSEIKIDETEIHTYDNGFHPKEVKLREKYKFYHHNWPFRIWTRIVVYFIAFVYFFPKKLYWGYKVRGKKNLRHLKGYTIVSNHVHPSDAFLIVTALKNKRVYTTMIQSNLGFGAVSRLFRYGGAVPIPTDVDKFKKFMRETESTLKRGANILVYPEAALVPYCDHIREFKPGAFRFALSGNEIIIPSVTTFHKPKGLYKLTRRKKPCLHYNILPPYKIEELGNKKETLNKAMEDVHKIMSDYFIEKSDYFK